MTAPALLGPPWRVVTDPRAILFVDPPALTACDALAAASPSLGILLRAFTPAEVQFQAKALADAGDGVSYVYKGAIQTHSGAWLWPFPQERVATAKADNPLTRQGFARIVQQLARSLEAESASASRRILSRNLRELRRPWPSMTPGQVNEALEGIAGIVRQVPGDRRFQASITASMESVAVSTAEASALGVAVNAGVAGTAFNIDETALARRIGRDGAAFVSDEFGRRSVRASRVARRIIQTDVNLGLGPAEIGRDLQGAMQVMMTGRDEFYYRVVANTAVSRARGFGQVRGYTEAGIPRYTWEAVMDARTCEICRFLHGQEFPVSSALDTFQRANRDPSPEASVNAFPWYRIVGGQTVDGVRQGGTIHVQPRQGPIGAAVATVRDSAAGTNDQRGTFRVHSDPSQAGGTVMPPAHGNCRCTTLPV